MVALLEFVSGSFTDAVDLFPLVPPGLQTRHAAVEKSWFAPRGFLRGPQTQGEQMLLAQHPFQNPNRNAAADTVFPGMLLL